MSDVYTADCELSKFCNSMFCEGHANKLRFIEAKFPTRSFYLMKREELRSGLGVYREKIEQYILIVMNLTAILAAVLCI